MGKMTDRGDNLFLGRFQLETRGNLSPWEQPATGMTQGSGAVPRAGQGAVPGRAGADGPGGPFLGPLGYQKGARGAGREGDLSLPLQGHPPHTPYGVLQAASAPPPALQGGTAACGAHRAGVPCASHGDTDGDGPHTPPSGTVLLGDTPMSWATPTGHGAAQRGVGLGQVGQGRNDVSCQHIPA